MKISKKQLKQIIEEELAIALSETEGDEDLQAFDAFMNLRSRPGGLRGDLPGDRGEDAFQEVTPEEIKEFESAGTGIYGVMRVSKEDLAMAYAADFLKKHRILGMYQNDIWFQDLNGKVYKISRSGQEGSNENYKRTIKTDY